MDIVERIRSRPNDAPMPTERLLDEAADEIERLRLIVATVPIISDEEFEAAMKAEPTPAIIEAAKMIRQWYGKS